MAVLGQRYQEIAADLRRGLGGPGEPVPSTRQVVRTYGVALATAARALDVLKQEGLIEAVPRVGYVVAAPAKRRPRRRDHAELVFDRIVAAALDLADEEGLDAVSIRGVAGRLGVPAMSLHRHIGDKETLVLALADAAFGDLVLPADPGGGWRSRLEASARAQWQLYRRRPWLAQLNPLGRPVPSLNLLRHADWLMASLVDLGLPPETQMTMHITLFNYVRGIAVNLEAEARAQAESGLSEDEWLERQTFPDVVASGEFPSFTRVVGALSEGYDFDLDHLFTFGLHALLEGFAGVVREAGYHREGSDPF
ncbi:TetR/AcrR family transcriptional regulator C-terminal domain-containing protein [Nonomuraea sp. NPDC050663]|uniref:TetR/AcrR family transcriptional regulator C-terminal domain-containing protein n=1 Tax=Nonomuraea sp. NPDC050663 TaxID=3364370 RepID=UPI0037BDAB9E